VRNFDLNIERVLEDWTVAHALREIIANALDEHVLTASQEPAICRDAQGNWHIRDWGRGLRDLAQYRLEWEESFRFAFVDPGDLTEAELAVWERLPDIFATRGGRRCSRPRRAVRSRRAAAPVGYGGCWSPLARRGAQRRRDPERKRPGVRRPHRAPAGVARPSRRNRLRTPDQQPPSASASAARQASRIS
jgi:hypothetical protein